MLSGDATEQTPPDLPSFLFKERIVYLVCTAALLILRFRALFIAVLYVSRPQVTCFSGSHVLLKLLIKIYVEAITEQLQTLSVVDNPVADHDHLDPALTRSEAL